MDTTSKHGHMVEESKTYTPSLELGHHSDYDVESGDKGLVNKVAPLSRDLKGRHMQMIAIGK